MVVSVNSSLSDPQEYPSRPVVPRNAFKIASLPWQARLYAFAYHGSRRSRSGNLAAALARRAYRFSQQLRLPSTGRFELALPKGDKTIAFDAHNTQFHAIYLPKYRSGYEVETGTLIDTFASETSSFWDIGANWGYFSLHLAAHPEFSGSIHAFEPFPRSHRDLASAVEQSGLQKVITCHEIALSDKSGEVGMKLADNLHSGLGMVDESSGGARMACSTADSLPLPPPSLIKMDVEGHELAVLKGAAATIQSAKPWIILENWREKPTNTLSPLHWLEDAGYQLYIPAWIDSREPGMTHLTQDFHTQGGLGVEDTKRLALVRIRAVQRYLFSEHVNLFAAHKDKAELLKLKFPANRLSNILIDPL